MWVLSHRRKKMRTLCILERLLLRTSSKRCELRYGDIEPAPKPSSSSKILKYLGSRVLLFSDRLWLLCRSAFSSLSYLCFFISSYSCLTRVSRGFKWILGTSPRMTIKNVCSRMTIKNEYEDCASQEFRIHFLAKL